MPKVKQSIERVQHIDELIASGRKLNRTQLLDKLNMSLDEDISLSSLDKDIKYLRSLIQASGSDVELLSDPLNGYRYSEPGYSHFKSSITETDKQFLELGLNLFDIFNGTELQEEYRQLIQKLVAKKLSQTGNKAYVKRTVQLSDQPNTAGNIWLKVLLEAIINKEPLEMKYTSKSGGRTEVKKISPYFLKPHQGGWYLIAYDEKCQRSEKTNVYSLNSIQHLEISNHKFHEPEFDINKYFTHSLGIWHWHEHAPIMVQLEFFDHIEEVRLNPIHRTQVEIQNRVSDSLLIEINVFDSPELDRLILGFGNKVKVVSPASVAIRIHQAAADIAALYR